MQQEALNAVFSALADPTRRAILARLAKGDASVGELAEPFDLSLPTVSRHIDVLEQARLVVRERDAQWRRCHFQREPLMEASEWINRYVAFWNGRLDALAELVENLPAAKKAPRAAPRKAVKRKSRKEPR
jgi:DNA-binding transcriptional ArsR family regulator